MSYERKYSSASIDPMKQTGKIVRVSSFRKYDDSFTTPFELQPNSAFFRDKNLQRTFSQNEGQDLVKNTLESKCRLKGTVSFGDKSQFAKLNYF